MTTRILVAFDFESGNPADAYRELRLLLERLPASVPWETTDEWYDEAGERVSLSDIETACDAYCEYTRDLKVADAGFLGEMVRVFGKMSLQHVGTVQSTPLSAESAIARLWHRGDLTNFNKVREFMALVGQDIADEPTHMPDTVHELRMNLLKEELQELDDAHEARNLVKIADALGDILYVTYGHAAALGIDMDAVFAEIHRTNMAKAPGGVVTRRADGKVLKPEGWQPPDEGIAKILEAQRKT